MSYAIIHQCQTYHAAGPPEETGFEIATETNS